MHEARGPDDDPLNVLQCLSPDGCILRVLVPQLVSKFFDSRIKFANIIEGSLSIQQQSFALLS